MSEYSVLLHQLKASGADVFEGRRLHRQPSTPCQMAWSGEQSLVVFDDSYTEEERVASYREQVGRLSE